MATLEGPRPYEPIAVFDYHYVGPDQRPTHHFTRLRIQALESNNEPLVCYPYKFDTNFATVTAHSQQGDLRLPEPYQVEGDIFGIDVPFAAPLQPGDVGEVSFTTEFDYPSPPDPRFCRRVGSRVGHLEMCVVFDESCVPRRIFRAEWDGYKTDDPIKHKTPLNLDDGAMVAIRGDYLAEAVVGIGWRWSRRH